MTASSAPGREPGRIVDVEASAELVDLQTVRAEVERALELLRDYPVEGFMGRVHDDHSRLALSRQPEQRVVLPTHGIAGEATWVLYRVALQLTKVPICFNVGPLKIGEEQYVHAELSASGDRRTKVIFGTEDWVRPVIRVVPVNAPNVPTIELQHVNAGPAGGLRKAREILEAYVDGALRVVDDRGLPGVLSGEPTVALVDRKGHDRVEPLPVLLCRLPPCPRMKPQDHGPDSQRAPGLTNGKRDQPNVMATGSSPASRRVGQNCRPPRQAVQGCS